MEQTKECLEVAGANLMSAIWLLGDAIETAEGEVRAKLIAERKTLEKLDARLNTIRMSR